MADAGSWFDKLTTNGRDPTLPFALSLSKGRTWQDGLRLRASAIGIDLRGSERRPTGVACLDESLVVESAIVRRDADILEWVSARVPQVVAIDAPLGLPEGRCCADPTCSCARFGIVRQADRLLAKRGYHPFWTLLPSMVNLTLRGIALRAILEGQGLCVVETFPGAAQDILGLPRKQHGLEALRSALESLGLRLRPGAAHDELDAATAAYSGLLYLQGGAEVMAYGEAVFVLPSPQPAPTGRGGKESH